jgi:hypothetical protein
MAIVTITELVLNFAEACRFLVPSLNRAEVSWRDGAQGPNWDRIAEPLFETLVTEPCAFQAVGEGRLMELRSAVYGFAPAGDCNAWIIVEGSGRMIDLASVEVPFDHVRCEELNELVPLEVSRFAFVYDDGNGIQHRIEAVDLAAE